MTTVVPLPDELFGRSARRAAGVRRGPLHATALPHLPAEHARPDVSRVLTVDGGLLAGRAGRLRPAPPEQVAARLRPAPDP